MLIATDLYRQPQGFESIGVVELGLFDTSDCTIKRVHFTKLDEYPDERLLNYYKNQCMTIRTGITYYIKSIDSFVSYFDGVLRIGDLLVEISKTDTKLMVNTSKFNIDGAKYLLYPFIMFGYVILRFTVRDNDYSYFTVAVKDSDIKFWTSDYSEVSDKVFAVKIDTLAGGV